MAVKLAMNISMETTL